MAAIGQPVKKSKGRTCPFNSWLKMGMRFSGPSTVPLGMAWFNWRATTPVVPFVVAKMANSVTQRPHVIRLLNSYASMKMSNRLNRASVDVSAILILFLSLGAQINHITQSRAHLSILSKPDQTIINYVVWSVWHPEIADTIIFTIHKYTLMNQE